MRVSIKSCFTLVFFLTTEGRQMIDTLKVRFSGTPPSTMPVRRRVELAGGVRFWHDGMGNCKAEAELPKLLWGHNSRLIVNQAELDASVERLRSILSQNKIYASREAELVLIDLVWQFKARTDDVILAHQWQRFSGVRNLPSLLCGGKSIVWRGTRVGLKFYRKADGVLRVELRLAGEQLRKRLNAVAPLNFAELYRVYRTELLKLEPLQLPEPRKHSTAEIIGAMPLEIQNRAILAYQQGRTARAVSGLKRDVTLARIKMVGWNLRDLLPAENPPPAVHCEPRRRQARL